VAYFVHEPRPTGNFRLKRAFQRLLLPAEVGATRQMCLPILGLIT